MSVAGGGGGIAGKIDASLAPHIDAIQLRGARTKLLASNIANVDTPGYKARDLAFGDTLARTLARSVATAGGSGAGERLALRTSHAGHVARGGSDAGAAARVMYRQPEAASLDGNTVDKDLEQARFAENALRYQASLQFLQNRVGSLLRALKGE